MEIATKQFKRVDLVQVRGRLDHTSAPQFEKALRAIMNKDRYRIVVDMSGLEYTSSAGLKVLIAAHKQSRKYNRGDVRLAALQPQVMQTFKLVGVDKIFKIYDSVVAAVGDF